MRDTDMMLTMRSTGFILAVAALLAAGCASSTSAPGNTPPSGPALASTSAPSGGSATARTAATTGAATATGTTGATVPDGTYAFELSNSGFSAELLLAVRQNTLVISQLNVANNTGSAVNAVPRIRYIDPEQRTFDAITEPDWRALYPENGAGLANGQRAQIRVGFAQPFNPDHVTFCLNLGPEDLGCFARRGAATPGATP
jgi:hypothetical protein